MLLKISVVIPSYRRVQSLALCLEALHKQSRRPDEIIVIVRDSDVESNCFLQQLSQSNVKKVPVYEPGVVKALNVGLQHARGDIIVITDDDTRPYSNWLEKIGSHFQTDESLGGVGGKDWVYHSETLETGQQKRVGKLYWYGKMVGNHHIGIGNVRKVDILKGANMSFRKEAIKGLEFDTNLKGNGAQVHLEIAFSLAIKDRGWKLIYDPSVCVNHYPAERFDEDKRDTFNEIAMFNMAHNETYSILKHSNFMRRLFFVIWIMLIGSRPSPGIAQLLRLFPQDGAGAVTKIITTYKGRWEGWRTWKMWRSSIIE